MAEYQLPEYLKDQPFDDITDSLSKSLGQGAPPLLSIKGNRFTLIDVAGNEKPVETFDKGLPYIDVCILDSLERESKIYFRDAFDPDNPGPPTCFSDNGIAPSKNAAEPQSPTCPSCQWFAWGSAISKKDGRTKIKACGDYQKLGVLPIGIEGVEGPYLLRVPPNSLTRMREFTAWCKTAKVPMVGLITRISFVPDQLGTLSFQAINFIDEATKQRRNEIRVAKATDAMIGRLDQPITQLVASQPAPQIAQPVQQPQGFQPTPFAPSAVPPSQPAPSTTSAVASMPAALSPRRGRPRKAESGNGPQEARAPFPTTASPPAAFGIKEGQTPGEQMSAQITSVFGPHK